MVFKMVLGFTRPLVPVIIVGATSCNVAGMRTVARHVLALNVALASASSRQKTVVLYIENY